MPFVKVYIHFVWSTKNRFPYLDSKELRLKVWKHIRDNAKEKDIFVDFVSGYTDHCHCLVSLGSNQTIRNVVQLIKGESSYWINKEELTFEKFEWQDEYFAASVSEQKIKKVGAYIKNQEEHHKHITFEQEYEEMFIKFRFEKFKDF